MRIELIYFFSMIEMFNVNIMSMYTKPTELLYDKKNAKQLFANIPDGSRIIIMPPLEETERFNEWDEEIEKIIKTARAVKAENQVSEQDYDDLVGK